MQRLKLIALVLLPLMMAALIFQNRQLTEVNLFFFKVPISVTVLLLVDLLVGFVIGVLVGAGLTRRQKQQMVTSHSDVAKALATSPPENRNE